MGSTSGSGTVYEPRPEHEEITPSQPLWDQSQTQSWVASEAGTPIPIPSTSQSRSRARARVTIEHQRSIESQRAGGSTAANSWRTLLTPSSWGGSSIIVNDDAVSLVGQDDDLEQAAGDGQRVAGMTYAQRRSILRRGSNKSLASRATRGQSTYNIHVAREKWTKRLEDFRTYEVGYFTARLPYKAAVGTTLAAFLFCFAPFVSQSIRACGLAGVVGVGMSLDTNVGLTLQKGCNVLIGASFAAVCAVAVTELEPYTGEWRPYYLVGCVFLGAFVTKRITLPGIVKTRWEQTLTFYLSIFHVLILSTRSSESNTAVQFFTIFVLYIGGLLISMILALWVMPEWAGDSLVALLVSDFHTAGVVLERIVEDYKTGTILTKIQEILSGVVTDDHIHHDMQYIMKSNAQAKLLINAAKWEPNRGFFFDEYPWDLYATLLDLLMFVMNDLIALDAALRAEIQAPLEIRQFFAHDMEIVARECSLLFHKMGEALTEHKKIDYHTNALRARLATKNLSWKLSRHSETLISHDYASQPPSRPLTRGSSLNSVKEEVEELPGSAPTPPPSPSSSRHRIIEEDFEVEQRLNMGEDEWLKRFLPRQESINQHWAETKEQISSLSFIKFAAILIELTGKIKAVVIMVDHISLKARFSDVPKQ